MFAVCKWQCCDGGCEYWRGNDERETHEHDRREKDMYIYIECELYMQVRLYKIYFTKKKKVVV